MFSNKNSGQTKKRKIEKLPENIRKKILIIILAVLMTIIILFWLTSLSFDLKSESEKTNDETWEEIKKDINDLFHQTKKNLDEVKNQFNQLNPATTTLEVSPEEIEKLKEKLMEKETIK